MKIGARGERSSSASFPVHLTTMQHCASHHTLSLAPGKHARAHSGYACMQTHLCSHHASFLRACTRVRTHARAHTQAHTLSRTHSHAHACTGTARERAQARIRPVANKMGSGTSKGGGLKDDAPPPPPPPAASNPNTKQKDEVGMLRKRIVASEKKVMNDHHTKVEP